MRAGSAVRVVDFGVVSVAQGGCSCHVRGPGGFGTGVGPCTVAGVPVALPGRGAAHRGGGGGPVQGLPWAAALGGSIPAVAVPGVAVRGSGSSQASRPTRVGPRFERFPGAPGGGSSPRSSPADPVTAVLGRQSKIGALGIKRGPPDLPGALCYLRFAAILISSVSPSMAISTSWYAHHFVLASA